MKTKFLPVLIVVLLCFNFPKVNAQEYMLKGVIQCFETLPVVGAEIYVKSTDEIVKTDEQGKFSVIVTPKEKLTISAHGFLTQKVKLEEGIKMLAVNLILKKGKKGKAYAIGYGHVMDEEKLSALVQLSEEDADFSSYTDMYELISGRFTGVSISGGQIIIRGESSLLGSNAAMIIVDGMEVGSSALNSLAPVDVKSIDVIKDGTAAIYGSRAAGGVVIIETKKGTRQ